MNQQSTGEFPTGLSRHQSSFVAGRRKLYIAVAILFMALVYLAFVAFQGATVIYLTVGELLNGGAEVGETVRISGTLVPESFQRESIGTMALFSLTDGDQTLPAAYNGIMPELFFNEHSDIVLEGYHDSGGVFRSHTVIVKCPSKYQAIADQSSGNI